MKFRFALTLILVFATLLALAQKKVEILHANTLEYSKKSGIEAKRLLGDVVFRHDEIYMFCDSAYFYDETKATATLTKGSQVYIFKRGSSNMYNGSEESEPEEMTDQAIYQGELYVGETDTQRYFKCNAEYLKNSEYSLCLTQTMQTSVSEFVQTLSEMFAGT